MISSPRQTRGLDPVYRRLFIALVLTLTLALSTVALAKVTVMRVGSFDATGTGTLVAQGNLTAFGKMEGTIIVRDRVGGALVKVNAVTQRPKLVRVGFRIVRVYTIRKAKGAFYARGKDLRIELRAPKAQLSVAIIGRGTVSRLDGEGTYTLNTDPTADWLDAPLPIHIRPQRAAPEEPMRTTSEIVPGATRL
jgi:hypothetical protein